METWTRESNKLLKYFILLESRIGLVLLRPELLLTRMKTQKNHSLLTCTLPNAPPRLRISWLAIKLKLMSIRLTLLGTDFYLFLRVSLANWHSISHPRTTEFAFYNNNLGALLPGEKVLETYLLLPYFWDGAWRYLISGQLPLFSFHERRTLVCHYKLSDNSSKQRFTPYLKRPSL